MLPTDPVLPDAFIGQPYSVIFSGKGGRSPLMLTGVNPPPGMSFAAGPGNQLELCGVPTQLGNFAATLTLTDSLPNGVVNKSYGTQLTAIGGIEPYRWRLDSAAPPGPTFSTAGFLGGRLTTSGIYPVVVTVVDQAGAEASAELSLTVRRSDLASLTPEILPDGSIGVPHNVPILREGGIPPYKAEVIRGSLPRGLRLSRDGSAIDGVPEADGEYKFEIQVRDGSKPPLRTRRKHVLTIN